MKLLDVERRPYAKDSASTANRARDTNCGATGSQNCGSCAHSTNGK